jgi:hypothetical protein
VVISLALSAGQFLLSAGTPVNASRCPTPVLLHQGSAGIGGTAMDIAIQAQDLGHTRDTVLGLIAEDTGQSVERVTDDSLRDRWYTVQQAMEYGFVHRIIEHVDGYTAGQSSRREPRWRTVSSYTIPYVTVRYSNGSQQTLDIYSSLLTERITYLGTPWMTASQTH